MEKTYIPVTTAEELQDALARSRRAQEAFSTYTQEQVDKIFFAAAVAANQMRIPLAKQAVAEVADPAPAEEEKAEEKAFPRSPDGCAGAPDLGRRSPGHQRPAEQKARPYQSFRAYRGCGLELCQHQAAEEGRDRPEG